MIRDLILYVYWRGRRWLGNKILPDIPERDGKPRERRVAIQEWDAERRRWLTVTDVHDDDPRFVASWMKIGR